MSKLFLAAVGLCFSIQATLGGPNVVIRDAPEIVFPAGTDSNSPAHWDGDTFYLFNSTGHPSLHFGSDQFHLGKAEKVELDKAVEVAGGRWIEATWRASDGALYSWYHNEPPGLCPGSRNPFSYGGLTAPRIGAMKSTDNGATWTELGFVLEAPEGTLDCKAKNGYFAGGNGDFSVMLDSQEQYLYFFFGTYAGDLAEQGVSIARMAWSDRDQQHGKVWKYHQGEWKEPGIRGHISPIFPAKISWMAEDADAFWGPSIHWNTHLKSYVILLNRTRYKPGWPQEGIYVSYSTDLSDPESWTGRAGSEGGSWYPQVLGVDAKAKETDKLCGRQARFYMHGKSSREILFLREGEKPNELPPVYTAE